MIYFSIFYSLIQNKLSITKISIDIQRYTDKISIEIQLYTYNLPVDGSSIHCILHTLYPPHTVSSPHYIPHTPIASYHHCLRWNGCFLLVKPGTRAEFEKADSFLKFWLQHNVNDNETIDHVINTIPSIYFIQYFLIYNIYTTICLKSLDIDDQRDIAIYIVHLWYIQ